MTKIIKPSTLKGEVIVPPSKSLSHRAILAAALAEGESVIENLVFSEDIEATCRVIEALGVKMFREETTLRIQGTSALKTPNVPLDCNESGSTLRFLIPFAGLIDGPVTFTGKGKLVTRPLDPYFRIFNEQQIQYNYEGALPLTVDGQLKSGVYRLPGNVSSQFVTGLMYVLPLLEGNSEIILESKLESRDYVELTLQILEVFGVKVETIDNEHYKIHGNQMYRPAKYRVEGDYSQAAFWVAAGLMGDGLLLTDLAQNTKQGDQRILEIAKDMGANFTWKKEQLEVSRTQTEGTVIDASQCPDLVPIVATLAAVSKGKTHIINAGRVRIKESDRLKAICTELKVLGANIEEEPEGLIIEGVERLTGGNVAGWNDHRIVMSLAIASTRCDSEVIIEGSEAVAKSYPHFFEVFQSLGGKLNEK
ncbi:MAG: 3-phosphoshikimate 1-carboxyvinyltransferase [Clostridiales bacterium 38-18]|nr:MAG: 3-phosphoshikimate 1-carboxyvinyltransferase [Clostridiales bacterium 38-18]